MKTNQTMFVKIKGFGNIVIGHKNKLAKVSDVLAVGNSYRATIGEKPIISLVSYFRKPSTWRTIIAIHNKMVEKSNSSQDYLENINKKVSSSQSSLGNKGKKANCYHSTLDIEATMKSLPRNKGNSKEIDYNAILKSKQFDHIIKSQKGGKVENRGYYVNLWLMIDIAMMMNEEFKVELIDIFIENKILEHRDAGGDNFKKLNRAIDTLPDRQPHLKPKGNKGVYINIAKLIRDKLNILESRGYNQEEHNAKVQELRDKIEDTAVNLIKMKMISSYPQLKTFIINFPI